MHTPSAAMSPWDTSGGGRAYVTGYGFDKSGYEDMVTLCYTPPGDLAWTQIYADPNGRSDRAACIAVDEAFSVFVAGDAWVGFENYYDFTTIHYTVGDCPADIDHSGAVDISDLLAVLQGWGVCADPGNCPADVDHSGAVDIVDLIAVLVSWGPCEESTAGRANRPV